MQDLPDVHATYLVRTWFGDDDAWERVVRECHSPGPEGFEPSFFVVDDPANAGATVDDVLLAVPLRNGWAYLLVADERTFTEGPPSVLVVDSFGEEQPFRSEAASVPDLEANLPIANMSFWEFARVANDEADGVYRGIGRPSATRPIVPDPPPAPWRMISYYVSCSGIPDVLAFRAVTAGGRLISITQVIPPPRGVLGLHTIMIMAAQADPTVSPADEKAMDPDGVVGLDCPACGRHEDISVAALVDMALSAGEGSVPFEQTDVHLSVDDLLDRLSS